MSIFLYSFFTYFFKDESSGSSSSGSKKKEQKIIFETRSEVDLIDDGFRWRKYGQKSVKGNPHPRYNYIPCCYQLVTFFRVGQTNYICFMCLVGVTTNALICIVMCASKSRELQGIQK